MSKVLLIEPDKIIAGNAAKVLNSRGHKVHWSKTAQSAVDASADFDPELIILDLQLAGHSGLEFLHELRSHPDWQAVPVIIYSSVSPDTFGGEDMAKYGLTAEAYVHKTSSSLSELADEVEKALAAR